MFRVITDSSMFITTVTAKNIPALTKHTNRNKKTAIFINIESSRNAMATARKSKDFWINNKWGVKEPRNEKG